MKQVTKDTAPATPQTEISIKKLASKLVGDGKRPNKYFVTIAYGWYLPMGEDQDMIQPDNSLDCQTVLFTDKESATDFYNSVRLVNTNKVTGETISQVMIEDRLTGVVKEKFLEQIGNNYFTPRYY